MTEDSTLSDTVYWYDICHIQSECPSLSVTEQPSLCPHHTVYFCHCPHKWPLAQLTLHLITPCCRAQVEMLLEIKNPKNFIVSFNEFWWNSQWILYLIWAPPCFIAGLSICRGLPSLWPGTGPLHLQRASCNDLLLRCRTMQEGSRGWAHAQVPVKRRVAAGLEWAGEWRQNEGHVYANLQSRKLRLNLVYIWVLCNQRDLSHENFQAPTESSFYWS